MRHALVAGCEHEEVTIRALLLCCTLGVWCWPGGGEDPCKAGHTGVDVGVLMGRGQMALVLICRRDKKGSMTPATMAGARRLPKWLAVA
eukprot:1155430-Pelagomonas_calceolata.AAC.8